MESDWFAVRKKNPTTRRGQGACGSPSFGREIRSVPSFRVRKQLSLPPRMVAVVAGNVNEIVPEVEGGPVLGHEFRVPVKDDTQKEHAHHVLVLPGGSQISLQVGIVVSSVVDALGHKDVSELEANPLAALRHGVVARANPHQVVLLVPGVGGRIGIGPVGRFRAAEDLAVLRECRRDASRVEVALGPENGPPGGCQHVDPGGIVGIGIAFDFRDRVKNGPATEQKGRGDVLAAAAAAAVVDVFAAQVVRGKILAIHFFFPAVAVHRVVVKDPVSQYVDRAGGGGKVPLIDPHETIDLPRHQEVHLDPVPGLGLFLPQLLLLLANAGKRRGHRGGGAGTGFSHDAGNAVPAAEKGPGLLRGALGTLPGGVVTLVALLVGPGSAAVDGPQVLVGNQVGVRPEERGLVQPYVHPVALWEGQVRIGRGSRQDLRPDHVDGEERKVVDVDLVEGNVREVPVPVEVAHPLDGQDRVVELEVGQQLRLFRRQDHLPVEELVVVGDRHGRHHHLDGGVVGVVVVVQLDRVALVVVEDRRGLFVAEPAHLLGAEELLLVVRPE
mmetsp:Transcript_20223/g.42006  ORF Transcript_20223/g.42006 Transcript_20223/m.42006 type:complete len:555 (-) Transcript_20223:474-2138(-)